MPIVDPETYDEDELSTEQIIGLSVAAVVLFLVIPGIVLTICWLIKRKKKGTAADKEKLMVTPDAKVADSKITKDMKNQSGLKVEVKNEVVEVKKPQKPVDLREGEVLVERKPKGGEGRSDPATTKHQAADGEDKRLQKVLLEDNGIGKPGSFAILFKRLAFQPTLLEVMKSGERDPTKSLIQNWFEYCQPQFEIPPELTVWSVGNPEACINPQVHAWDVTAYLVEDQHFIHASTVPMPGEVGGKGKAIICQAPMDETFIGKKDTRPLFWKMINEVKADVIVMACQFVENGVTTCGQYFPTKENEPVTYGDITVTLTESHVSYDGELMMRKLAYTDKEKKLTQSLSHFQFLKWKQRTIPSDAGIEAIKFVNQQVRKRPNPYICHSNLGTGRSCVFTGIEYLSSMICNKSSRVSTHCFQVDFRSKRMGALETGEQLYFVQNMTLDMLVTEFGYSEFNEKMKIEWDHLHHYHDKGQRNKKMIKDLESHEIEKFGEIIPFTSNGKKATILTVSAPPVTKVPSLRDKEALAKIKNEMEADQSHTKSGYKPLTITAVDKSKDQSVDKTQTVTKSMRPPVLCTKIDMEGIY